MPIIEKDTVIGVLNIESPFRNAFDFRLQEVLKIFCLHVVVCHPGCQKKVADQRYEKQL